MMDSLNSTGNTELKEALKFAQEMADGELKRIERMHKMSIAFLSVLAGGFGVLLAVFSWIGFANLKRVAVSTARAQMQEEVTQQVRSKLTSENINGIVRTETHDFAESELRSQIGNEINHGPLHAQIVATAAGQSRELIKRAFAPRRLTEGQSKAIANAIKDAAELQKLPVSESALPLSLEAEHFSKDIYDALLAGGMSPGDPRIIAQDNGHEGLTIYYDATLSDQAAQKLAQILRASGINAKVVGAPYNMPNPKAQLIIYAGQQLFSTDK